MCDACLRLGSPWLPALHEGEARPRSRPKAKLQLKRHKVTRAVAKSAAAKTREPRTF